MRTIVFKAMTINSFKEKKMKSFIVLLGLIPDLSEAWVAGWLVAQDIRIC